MIEERKLIFYFFGKTGVKKSLIFVDEIGCQQIPGDSLFNFRATPEPAGIHFIIIDVNTVVTGTEKREYQFFFPGALP